MLTRHLKETFFIIVFLCIFLIVGYSEAAIEGTIGTRFTLTGSEFGSQKPTVYAQYETSPGQIKKVSAKVEGYSDISVTCIWTGVLPSGTYKLFLKPKTKGALPISMGDFIVKNPIIENAVPNTGSRGDVISIQGYFFSSAKPRIYLEDPVTLKRTNCSVSDSTMDTATGVSSLHFVVPKSGLNQHHLVLKNKIGEVVSVYPYQLLASVTGRVTDISGVGIENVEIAGPDVSATTDAGGAFILSSMTGKDRIFVFSHDGYLPSSKILSVFSGATTYVPVTMMAIAAPSPLNATSGGAVTGKRGASLSAPQDAFVDSADNPVTGPVEVSLTPYDPAIPQEARAYPGELRGLTLTGKIVPLKTYGLMDVTVKQGGKTLRVREGKTINLGLPAPSKGEKPATVQMWRFDPQQALWIQNEVDGTYDAGTNRYLTTVGSGMFLDVLLNCDNPLRPSCIYGIVADADGNPVVGARITAQSADPYGAVGIYSEWQTQEPDGHYCLTVEMDSQVLLTVTANDGTTTERRIKAGSSLSQDYPANCYTSKCKQIRTIIIGTPDPGEDTADCNVDSLAFSETCASGLGDFYDCFHPDGKCTYDLSFGPDFNAFSYEVTFDNGSKVTQDPADPLSMIFYGPNPLNNYCGKIAASGGVTTISPESGGSVTLLWGTVDSATIICENGDTFDLNRKQIDALAGCSTRVGDTGIGTECKPAPGSFMASCFGDNDCNKGLKCCGSIWSPTLEKQCVLGSFCDLICSVNAECGMLGHDFICCFNGLFDQCLPVDACQ
jgi:hypothetical protein